MRRALLTLALSTGLVACGGEDPMSTEDYRAELKTICEDSDKRSSAVEQPTRATPEAIANYFKRLRDVNVETIEQVEELEPPEDLADAHDSAIEANKEGREKIDEIIEELEKGGDPTTVLNDAKAELEDVTKRANDAAEEVGVPACVD
jgi:hypothetical protein